MRSNLREKINCQCHITLLWNVMKISTNLYGSISLARHTKSDPLAARAQQDLGLLHSDNSTRLLLRKMIRRVDRREHVLRRNRQEAAIKRPLQVSVISTDRVIDRHQTCAGRERSLDLELLEVKHDGSEDMAAPQHRFANGHEVGNGVIPIADKLRRDNIVSVLQFQMYKLLFSNGPR